jgi:hypothetical protein
MLVRFAGVSTAFVGKQEVVQNRAWGRVLLISLGLAAPAPGTDRPELFTFRKGNRGVRSFGIARMSNFFIVDACTLPGHVAESH